MVENFVYFAGEAQRYQTEVDNLPNDVKPRVAAKLREMVKGFRLLAQSCAKDAAPYAHPKLASTWVKSDSQRVTTIRFEPGDETI